MIEYIIGGVTGLITILLIIWYFRSCRFARNVNSLYCIEKRKEVEAKQQLRDEIKKAQSKKSDYVFN